MPAGTVASVALATAHVASPSSICTPLWHCESSVDWVGVSSIGCLMVPVLVP